MTLSRRQHWLVGLALATMLSLLAWLSMRNSRKPKLTLTYLSQANENGRLIAYFAVTNSGAAAAINYRIGAFEVFGQTQTVSVASLPKLHRLAPGVGDILQVHLPPGFKGRWRYKCQYAHEGIRSRISDWQWGKGGPGARANWFIPPSLKGVPLDVKATSQWVDE